MLARRLLVVAVEESSQVNKTACCSAASLTAFVAIIAFNMDRVAYWVLKDYTSQSAGEEVPVTPGVHHAGHTEYFENRPTTSSEKLPFDPAGATPGPSWSNNSVYTNSDEQSEGISLIKRLAKANIKDAIKSEDPVQRHPKLSLSGRVISATFNVPYSIGYSPGNDWVCSASLLLVFIADNLAGLATTSRYFSSLRLTLLSRFFIFSMEPYAGRLDWRASAAT